MSNKKIFILPYKSGSKSAKALATALGSKRIKLKNSHYRPSQQHLVINWGSRGEQAVILEESGLPLLNPPSAVRKASCKLRTFKTLSSEAVPMWTVCKEEAASWIGSGLVVCRGKLNGHSGQGIVIASTVDELIDAPLYVKYINKKHEYRVHVVNGKVIDQQRKMRSREVADEDVNWKIRNHSNGFIFGREGVDLPQEALDMCVESVGALGLDFGAVDMVWNERDDRYYVLEVNTACGLTGTTLEKYVEAFKEIANG